MDDPASISKANKFLSKSRWGRKIGGSSKETPDDALAREAQKLQVQQDVDDFLKPSTQKSHPSLPKPRIDIAAAQRWPSAKEILSAARSPGAGLATAGLTSSLRGSENAKPKRAKGLSVSFARTAPEIVGHGGDETEEAPIEVSKRKNSVSSAVPARPEVHQDDSVLGMRTPDFNGWRGDQGQTTGVERPVIPKRSTTSHGEISPPLQAKMEMGNITSQAQPPPPPPRGVGPMGLGERPKPLQRAPTGFGDVDDGVSRPSFDSTFSRDSDDFNSLQRGPSVRTVESVAEENEEEDFVPRPMLRTQTGFANEQISDQHPSLPDFNFGDDSPIMSKKHFLESEPSDPSSFAARVQHQMRAEEGRALHAGVTQPATDSDGRPSLDSGSSYSNTTSPESYRSPPFPAAQDQFQRRPTNTTRPSHEPAPPQGQLQSRPSNATRPSYEPAPPKGQLQPRPSNATRPSYEPAPSQGQLQPQPSNAGSITPSRTPEPRVAVQLESEPHRSHARKPSQDPPIRKPLPSPVPGSEGVDSYFNGRPGSNSSNYATPLTTPMVQGSSLSPKKGQFSNVPSRNNSLRPAPPSPRRSSPGHAASHSLNQIDFGQSLQSPQAPAFQNAGPQVPIHRSDTRSQGNAALVDFADRVTHMQGIFRLTAEMEKPLYEATPMQWLRASIWWFLRGRSGMEALIRAKPRGDAAAEGRAQLLAQPHVDLAKTWWIVAEVLRNHPGLRKYGDMQMESQALAARQAGDTTMADIYDTHDVVLSYLKLLLASMKRHQVMPPRQSLIQGQDQTIWQKYPNFSLDAQAILSAQALHPASCMPVGDTKADFVYARMFVTASLTTEEAETDRVPMTCVLSVMRPHNDLSVKITICSMTELVNITVQNDAKARPTWEDVQWKVKTRGLYVTLPRGYTLSVELNEQDFRQLWAIVDHTNKVASRLRSHGDERVVYDQTLRDLKYTDPTNPQAFPAERVKRCRTIVFERCVKSNEGTGKRRLHRGFRIVVVTNPKSRTLSCVSHDLGLQKPMNFEILADAEEGGFPAMVLRPDEVVDGKPKQCTMFLVFNDGKDRNSLYGTLTGSNVTPDETVFAQVPLKNLVVENLDQAEGFTQSGHAVLQRLHWNDLKALNMDPEIGNMDGAQVVLSESLRVVARHSAGALTDRMNMTPGEFRLRLQTSGSAEIIILRNPQEDMSAAIDAKHCEPDIPDELAELLRTVATASTLRTYSFHNLKDLHTFQLATTGFFVKFDGIAASFAIARRRMVVPIYKRWESAQVRIQVVQQDNIIQLLAFFEEFSHADAMNFQLKSMDTFEKHEKGGKFLLKLVDAKFALPVEERKGEGKIGQAEGKQGGWAGARRRFVCLDVIEYPGEHDDVTVGFESAVERDRFAEALPAASQIGRQITFKRKI
ncbi:hypothetical protein BU16DRAFT_587070 [Lophium mytilinum]|uniref:Uncharacterized protein n=1 Tax=Lophium mytilinum TaxID=390894 RepID=A0A6A6Q881_9PEZI|nr:hypothetical protein BU16DRAFT_587070 [Lophium mytilinum]